MAGMAVLIAASVGMYCLWRRKRRQARWTGALSPDVGEARRWQYGSIIDPVVQGDTPPSYTSGERNRPRHIMSVTAEQSLPRFATNSSSSPSLVPHVNAAIPPYVPQTRPPEKDIAELTLRDASMAGSRSSVLFDAASSGTLTPPPTYSEPSPSSWQEVGFWGAHYMEQSRASQVSNARSSRGTYGSAIPSSTASQMYAHDGAQSSV